MRHAIRLIGLSRSPWHSPRLFAVADIALV
jgi:hypothetical protein